MRHPTKLEEHLDILANCDPDYVVDVLGITSADLVDTFKHKAIAHILEEFDLDED